MYRKSYLDKVISELEEVLPKLKSSGQLQYAKDIEELLLELQNLQEKR